MAAATAAGPESWPTFADFTFDLGSRLRQAARQSLAELELSINQDGDEWLSGYLDQVEAQGRRTNLADLMKTPSRTATARKTRVMTSSKAPRIAQPTFLKDKPAFSAQSPALALTPRALNTIPQSPLAADSPLRGKDTPRSKTPSKYRAPSNVGDLFSPVARPAASPARQASSRVGSNSPVPRAVVVVELDSRPKTAVTSPSKSVKSTKSIKSAPVSKSTTVPVQKPASQRAEPLSIRSPLLQAAQTKSPLVRSPRTESLRIKSPRSISSRAQSPQAKSLPTKSPTAKSPDTQLRCSPRAKSPHDSAPEPSLAAVASQIISSSVPMDVEETQPAEHVSPSLPASLEEVDNSVTMVVPTKGDDGPVHSELTSKYEALRKSLAQPSMLKRKSDAVEEAPREKTKMARTSPVQRTIFSNRTSTRPAEGEPPKTAPFASDSNEARRTLEALRERAAAGAAAQAAKPAAAASGSLLFRGLGFGASFLGLSSAPSAQEQRATEVDETELETILRDMEEQNKGLRLSPSRAPLNEGMMLDDEDTSIVLRNEPDIGDEVDAGAYDVPTSDDDIDIDFPESTSPTVSPPRPVVSISRSLSQSSQRIPKVASSRAPSRSASRDDLGSYFRSKQAPTPGPSAKEREQERAAREALLRQKQEQRLQEEARRKAAEEKRRVEEEERREEERKRKEEELRRRAEWLEQRRLEREKENERINQERAAREEQEAAAARAKAESEAVRKQKMTSTLVKTPGANRTLPVAKTPSAGIKKIVPPMGSAASSRLTAPTASSAAKLGPNAFRTKKGSAAADAQPRVPQTPTITLVKPKQAASRPPSVAAQPSLIPKPQPSAVLQQSRQTLQAQLDHKAAVMASEDIVLPDIASEYSDSDDEKDTDYPEWVESPELHKMLEAQALVNPDELFGRVRPPNLDEFFAGSVSTAKFRARTSSANWASGDGLTEAEEREYARRMGFKNPPLPKSRLSRPGPSR